MENDIYGSDVTGRDLRADMKVFIDGIDYYGDSNIKSVLKKYFPNLDEKEFTVCKMITYAHNDMGYGCYHCVVATTATEYKIFHDKKDVEEIVEKLTQKGVVLSNLIRRCFIIFLLLYVRDEI